MSLFNSLPKALDFTENNYKIGLLVGYLLNIDNHLQEHITLTAATSVVPASLSFAHGYICNITDIIDLHTRTLWLGDGKMSINAMGNFLKFLSDNDIFLSENRKIGRTIDLSCNKFIECLILEFSFDVKKENGKSRMHILPQTFNNVNYSIEAFSQKCANEVAVKIETDNERADESIEFDINEFIRGIRDGYKYR